MLHANKLNSVEPEAPMPNKRILLVEGENDKHVILALQGVNKRRFLDKDEIHACGDCDKLIEQFPVRLNESDISRLGILMDADANLAARWSQIRVKAEAAGYRGISASPSKEGTIIEAPDNSILPRVGIWLMPDNQSSGILEDYLKFLVPPECKLFAHAKSVVDQLPEKRFSQTATTNALIHTWLAWQKDPGRPLGQSITARYLDAKVAQVDTLMNWLQNLFDSAKSS